MLRSSNLHFYKETNQLPFQNENQLLNQEVESFHLKNNDLKIETNLLNKMMMHEKQFQSYLSKGLTYFFWTKIK